jgi:hypothetical protein
VRPSPAALDPERTRARGRFNPRGV